tara:strand:+ start:1271 stop:1570 length:300 start_codon:yes stop_codon:yes gene_type:complete
MDKKIENIEQRIINIEKTLYGINNTLYEINTKINNDIAKDCKKMGNHIDFVENIYNQIKHPLNYMCNKINVLMYSNDSNDSNDLNDLNNMLDNKHSENI